MNNLKVGDTFEFAIRDWGSRTHEPSAPCIVLQVNLVLSIAVSRKFLTRSIECATCKTMVGLRTTAARDNVKERTYFQILIGNEKWLVDYRLHNSLAIVTCPKE